MPCEYYLLSNFKICSTNVDFLLFFYIITIKHFYFFWQMEFISHANTETENSVSILRQSVAMRCQQRKTIVIMCVTAPVQVSELVPSLSLFWTFSRFDREFTFGEKVISTIDISWNLDVFYNTIFCRKSWEYFGNIFEKFKN